MRDRHRMSKFLLRHGLRMPNKSWGVTRRRWLGSLTFEYAHQQQAFQTYLHTLDLVDRRVEVLERQVDAAAKDGPWAELVARLRFLRGVDTLTALGLVAEIGTDWSRFKTAEQFMSFVGLVRPSAPPVSSAPKARSPRPATATFDGCSSRPPGISASAPASARSSPPASAARTRSCSSAPGAPSNACTAAGRGWPAAASHTRKSSSRPPASSPGSPGRSRPTNRSGATEHQPSQPSRAGAADAPTHTENPRRLYAAPPAGDPR
ncbi:MAG TPA: transposase, partial [Candidatus Limnocylindrales bacterium]|nr:transposase [Candidatus Limnocylindrales bacterium]